jgi:hypothetical protein
MRSLRTSFVGLIFVLLGIGSYVSWAVWLHTRVTRPVYLPMSMTTGHFRTPEFKVNLNAPYTIEVEVEKKNIPFDTLNCLLGTSMGPTSSELRECDSKPSVLRASWVLTSEGQTVAQGSTDYHRSGVWGNDTIARGLGGFQSQSGRQYVLDVDLLSDGASLAPGNPRLKVEVSLAFSKDVTVGGAFVSFVSLVLVLIGWVLLVISFRTNRHLRNATAAST